MARLPTLEDVLAGQRPRRARMRRKVRALRGPSRGQRLAAAPREPRAAALGYLLVQRALLEDIRALVERELVPALPEITSEARPLASLPDPEDARVGIRQDSAPCGVCGPLPGWYTQALLGNPVRRMDAIGGRLGAILAGLEVAITERVAAVGPLLEGVARSIWNHNRAEMSRVLQIDLRRKNLGLADFIREFIRKNVALIQSVAQGQLARMEATVARATAGQVRVETLRDEIMGTFGVSRARAALIARDQTLKSNSDLSQLRQQQVGVREYIWTTSRDERVRGNPSGKWAKSQSNHFILDGSRQSWLVAPVTNPVTGARNHPGQDYQCRCTATPIVDHLLGGPLEE